MATVTVVENKTIIRTTDPVKYQILNSNGRGADGKSTYELAVDSGFTGTAYDFVYSNLFGVITAKDSIIDSEGKALLPGIPYGDFVHNTALVNTSEGIIELNGLTHVFSDGSHYVKLNADDFALISSIGISLTVSYIGIL
jgi:hypothetical protein